MKDELEKDSKTNSGRRGFLAAAAGVPVLAAIGMTAGRPDDTPSEVPATPSSGTGYHETEHIRKYYFTAAYL
jgi:hypothetical protein